MVNKHTIKMNNTSTAARNCSLAILLACVLCVSSDACLEKKQSTSNGTDLMRRRYEEWQKRYGRNYRTSTEWNLRFGIYQSNVQFIDFINSQNLAYKLTDNQFADMTNLEFRSIYLGYKVHGHSHNKNDSRSHNHTEPPSSIDWRDKGAVTPIKNQGTCGGCWAFSAVAAVEGITQIKTGKLVSLSEQELIDCDTGSDQGCNGGYMNTAFDFIKKNEGITTEENYPYQARNGKCDKSKEKEKAATISGHETIPVGDEEALRAAAAKQPVSVAIDAGGFDFQLYSSGVYNGNCGTNLNHGVTIVGYGVEDNNTYWLVKNSWGKTWGEDGYIKIKRGSSDKNGKCGIAMMASYPTKDS